MEIYVRKITCSLLRGGMRAHEVIYTKALSRLEMLYKAIYVL